MKRLTSLFCVLAIAVVASACAETDPGITTSVKSKFAADDTVKAYQIDVDTREGVVTLSGNVPSAAAKQRAVALAREVDGVRNVQDNITVAGGSAALPGEYNTSPTGQAAEGEARDQSDTVADRAGQAGEAAGDAALTAAVKTKLLADQSVGGLKINVDTEDSVVTLSGTVNNSKEKAEAVRIARATEGVKTVRDNLKVAP